MMRTFLSVVFVAVALSACATPVTWQHATIPQEQWSSDKAECQRFAAREANKEFAKQSKISGTSMRTETSSYDARMAAYDNTRFERRTFERCMAAKGYSKVK